MSGKRIRKVSPFHSLFTEQEQIDEAAGSATSKITWPHAASLDVTKGKCAFSQFAETFRTKSEDGN